MVISSGVSVNCRQHSTHSQEVHNLSLFVQSTNAWITEGFIYLFILTCCCLLRRIIVGKAKQSSGRIGKHVDIYFDI